MIDLQNWIESNTYHHSEFGDLKKLVEAKEKQNLKISLCLPTLNEEKTIGKEVILFRSELVNRYPLLDEIAVIDSGSDDATLEIARNYGADTYLASEILPELEPKRGKGENLWKAIYALKGDIIVYVDSDIKNIRSRFAYGLLGPLLQRTDIQYVKAFYHRPLKTAGLAQSEGGGRVTEILIRPLFSLFFPELAAIIQPLAGEYAVRRGVLEQLAFPVGYGVETSHLIDVYMRWGLEALAQTDLDRRVHANQPTIALGRMSFGILRCLLSRLDRYDILEAPLQLPSILRQFVPADEGYTELATEIGEAERPPMIGVPEYRCKRGLAVS